MYIASGYGRLKPAPDAGQAVDEAVVILDLRVQVLSAVAAESGSSLGTLGHKPQNTLSPNPVAPTCSSRGHGRGALALARDWTRVRPGHTCMMCCKKT